VRYLKLYEEFKIETSDVDLDQPEIDVEISDYTIDDVLDGSLFGDDFEDKGSYIDSKGIIHIKNWNQY
jgi:hypothetical protein